MYITTVVKGWWVMVLLRILLILFITSNAFGVGFETFTNDTTPDATDIVYTIKDPSGTRLDRNATLLQMSTYYDTIFEGELTNSAGLAAALTNETGTVFAVFSDSPTFTTNITTPQITLTGANSSPNDAGEIRYDSTVTGMGDGALVWYDVDEIRMIVDIDSSETIAAGDDGKFVQYNWAAGAGYFDFATAITPSGTINANEIATYNDSTSIKALTEAEFKNTYNIGDGSLAVATLSDDTFTGRSITGLNAGESITQWNTVFLNDADGEYHQADADASGEYPCRGIAASTAADGSSLTIVTEGIIRNDGWTWTGEGSTLYLSDTAGGITETAPSTAGDWVQAVGWTISDDEMYVTISHGSISGG